MRKKLKKVALCFSGQARTLDLCYPYIKKNILDSVGERGKDYDIFCCVEEDANSGKTSILKPAKIKKVKPADVDRIIKSEIGILRKQNYKTSIFPESFRFNLQKSYRQMYQINESFELLKKYIKEKNVSYQYFIRIRFDFLPLDILKLSDLKIEKNEVIIPQIKIPHRKDIINDMFCVAKDIDTFESYCSLYNNFRIVVQNQLSIKPSFVQKMYFLFEKNYRYVLLNLFDKLNKGKNEIPRYLLGIALLFPNMFYKEFKSHNKYSIEKALLCHLKSKEIKIKWKNINFVIVRNLTDGLLIFGKE
ncbi:hypothetical protein COU59_01850 [Candidatus Pacearchaeota archaeon CG10_big_fil_rev_8_21_14_0_10_34_12]|nr:MAG: hypothetical protein COU59_01850 [Candidatus Pacearchaeota archaeon CG10_big_fil_rev_8_21_14_0_10_34_12]